MLKSLPASLMLYAFMSISYQATAQTTPLERKTDSLTRKLLILINRKQADSVYHYAGNSFRSQIDSNSFRQIAETGVFPLTPLPAPVFIESKKGVSKYRVNQFQVLVGLDNEGKFSTLLFQPYREQAVKAEKALSDNTLKTHLDSVVNKVLSPYIQTKGNVGLSAGIYINGKEYFYNYGETKQSNSQLPSKNTVYEIGSITKTFTSTLLAIAVKEGKVNLNTPIKTLLPDSVAFNPDLKVITFEQLVNHTSGLPRLPGNLLAAITVETQPYENYTVEHMFSFLKGFKAIRKPGSMYEYSNLGAGLTGVLLERIFKQPYQQLVNKYITGPANLRSTFFSITPANSSALAQGYNEVSIPVSVWKFLSIEAAGALKSTAADLLNYGKLQLKTDDSALTRAIQLTHQVTFKQANTIVGLGWHYLPGSSKVLQHTGGTGGYRSSVAIDLEKHIVIAVLTNNASTGNALGFQLIKSLQNDGQL